MRYIGGAYVQVPWLGLDDEGKSTRNWTRLTFRGSVDKRRVKREIRKFVKRDLDRTLHTGELAMCVRRIQDL